MLRIGHKSASRHETVYARIVVYIHIVVYIRPLVYIRPVVYARSLVNACERRPRPAARRADGRGGVTYIFVLARASRGVQGRGVRRDPPD